MAARKRRSANPSMEEPSPIEIDKTHQSKSPTADDPPIVRPKTGFIFKLILFFSVPYLYLIFYRYEIDLELRRSIIINAGLSLAGFLVTLRMIPVASRYVIKRNLFGYDINKRGTPQGDVKVPESLGIVVGISFLVVAIVFQYFNFTSDSNWLVEYNAALASICFMILLGFVDDVLDVPWRVKLLLPSFAALPLLMAYAGHTTIIIPKPLIPYLGMDVLDLGWIYKLYMGLLAVFCTNSINIHAGLNGLEVGQTVVIAFAILIHNIMQIGASTDPEYKQAHAFSIYLVQPLLATSLGLLAFNWYPSSVFVGDTYTYFAGMTMAVVGILGHFSETLLIFFFPQVLNFLLSLPQLFGFVACPRHRLPTYSLSYPIILLFFFGKRILLHDLIFLYLLALYLLAFRFNPRTRLLTGTNDGTLVNFFLRIFGRQTEKSLCTNLLVFQGVFCCFCFLLRYLLAGWYK